jgi:hypothetical protein
MVPQAADLRVDKAVVQPSRVLLAHGFAVPSLDQYRPVREISGKIHLKEDIGVIAGTRRSEDSESGRGAIVTRQSRGWSRTLRDLMRAAPRDLPDIGHPGLEQHSLC